MFQVTGDCDPEIHQEKEEKETKDLGAGVMDGCRRVTAHTRNIWLAVN